MAQVPNPTGLKYDTRAGRYRYANGRFVRFEDVRLAVDTVIAKNAGRAGRLTERLQGEAISLADWQAGMVDTLKRLHICNAAAAKGGFHRMSPEDWRAVGDTLKRQFHYLNRWAVQLEHGAAPLDGRAGRRAAMYANAARGTYEEIRRGEMVALGYTEERRVRHAMESCAGCVAEAGRGWQPIGTLAPIGTKQCLTACMCTFDYKRQNKAT